MNLVAPGLVVRVGQNAYAEPVNDFLSFPAKSP